MPERNENDENCDRDVYEENRSPGNGFHQPPSQDRPDSSRDRAEAGPRSDRPAAFVFGEGIADDGETPWNQQRRTDSLERPGRNQGSDPAREPARGGRRRENHHADHEYSAPPVTISQRTAHQEKRGEQERIRFNDPLHADDSGLQILLERGQRDIHDGAVDERQARTQNRRREDPLAG